MGLDWVLKDREVNGKKIAPPETLGAKRLYASDPESIKVFRAVYESRRKAIRASSGEKPRAVAAYNTDYVKFWDRPFEEVLKDAEPEHPVLGDTVTEQGGKAVISGMAVSDYDFRGKVVARILNELGEKALADRCYDDLDTEQMTSLADALTLARNKATGEDNELLKAAAEWLRFWANKGHSVIAWY